MSKELLPLGTVVYLKEGTEKIMIVGRGIVFIDQDTNDEVYTNYMGCLYPSGINPENTIFFNKENIDRVIFEGLVDEDEERFLELYDTWEEQLETPRKVID